MALSSLCVWPAVGAMAGLLARNIMSGTSPFGIMGDVIPAMMECAWWLYRGAVRFSGAGGIIGSIVVALPGALLIIRGAGKIKA